MTDHTNSAICPGQRNLMYDDRPAYLRVTITVFYSDGPSNRDFVYLHNYPLHPLCPETIDQLTDKIRDVFRVYQGYLRVQRVTFDSYMGCHLSDDKIKELAYRFIQGDNVPDPLPTPEPPPAPEPTPAPAPVLPQAPAPAPDAVVEGPLSIEDRLKAGSTQR